MDEYQGKLFETAHSHSTKTDEKLGQCSINHLIAFKINFFHIERGTVAPTDDHLKISEESFER
jgi:hypothetical protein